MYISLTHGVRLQVAAMLAQLDDNNREIEGQRFEIKRLREQARTPSKFGNNYYYYCYYYIIVRGGGPALRDQAAARAGAHALEIRE